MNERDKEFARQAKLPVMHPDWQEAAQAFADLIRADEREFCAKVCEESATDLSEGDWDSACDNCADLIRAKGNT